jgi:anti-sigma factor RsiW
MSETQNKLSWSAFCYVANEMDATEASEFESLLMTDQAAREAVADAVEESARIRQALAGAVVVTAASQRTKWNRKTTRVAVVTVGSCLTLLFVLFLVRSSVPIARDFAHQGIESDSSVSPAQLAYAWAEARNGLTELQPAVDADLADTVDSVFNGPIDSESEQSLVAPSWMLAALAKMDRGIDSGLDLQE